MTYNILILSPVGLTLSQHPSYESAETAVKLIEGQSEFRVQALRLYKKA